MPATPTLAAEGDSVSGVVRYEGPPVKLKALRIDADPKCEEIHGGATVLNKDRLVSEDGGLMNVFLYLKEAPAGGSYPVPETPVELRQEGCIYFPRVLGIQVTQKLDVYNDDDTTHNVRFLARANRPFNIGQPPATKKRTKFFTKREEAVKFRCDVHPWMSAFIFILDHPFYAVSGADGAFTIEGLPAGKHTLVAWHEKLGEQEIEIEVPASKEIELSFP